MRIQRIQISLIFLLLSSLAYGDTQAVNKLNVSNSGLTTHYLTVTSTQGLFTVPVTATTFDSGLGAFELRNASAVTTGFLVPADWTSFTAAYTDRLKWDGGATGLVALTGRNSLGLGKSSYPYFSGVILLNDEDDEMYADFNVNTMGELTITPSGRMTVIPGTVSATSVIAGTFNSGYGNWELRTADNVTTGFLVPTDWATFNTAYADRLKWDGGATGLTAATGRTSLGLGTANTPSFAALNISTGPLAVKWGVHYTNLSTDNTGDFFVDPEGGDVYVGGDLRAGILNATNNIVIGSNGFDDWGATIPVLHIQKLALYSSFANESIIGHNFYDAGGGDTRYFGDGTANMIRMEGDISFHSFTAGTAGNSLPAAEGTLEYASIVEEWRVFPSLKFLDVASSPSTPVAGARLHSESGELWAMDTKGNRTVISPHPDLYFEPDPTEALPVVHTSENLLTGAGVQIDLTGLAHAVEKLTGKTFVYYRDLPTSETITVDQWSEMQVDYKEKNPEFEIKELPAWIKTRALAREKKVNDKKVKP